MTQIHEISTLCFETNFLVETEFLVFPHCETYLPGLPEVDEVPDAVSEAVRW